jgi:hypothetical protein
VIFLESPVQTYIIRLGDSNKQVGGKLKMKLEDFISKTLEHVINGIKTAQSKAKENGISVFPHKVAFSQGSHMFNDSTGEPVDYIEFNIVVTSAKDSEDGEEDVFVPSTISGEDEDSIPYSPYMSRIKFSIPVHFNQKALLVDK